MAGGPENTVAVVGATGGTGRAVVARALETGMEVRALARRPADLDGLRTAALTVVPGDVLDPRSTALTELVDGAGAVVCALGVPMGRPPGRVCSDGTRALVAAMTSVGTARLVCVTASGINDSRDRSGVLGRVVIPLFLRARFADRALQEDLVRASTLDWTIVRPARLTDAPASGGVRTGTDLRLGLRDTVSRADLAAFCLRAAADPTTSGEAITITARAA